MNEKFPHSHISYFLYSTIAMTTMIAAMSGTLPCLLVLGFLVLVEFLVLVLFLMVLVVCSSSFFFCWYGSRCRGRARRRVFGT